MTLNTTSASSPIIPPVVQTANNAQAHVDEAIAKIDNLCGEIVGLQEAIADINSAIIILQQQLGELKPPNSNDYYTEQQRTVGTPPDQETITERVFDKAAFGAAMAAYLSEVQRLQSDIQQKQGELQSKETELASKEGELAQAESELQSAQQALEAALQEDAQALQEAQQRYQEAMDRAQQAQQEALLAQAEAQKAQEALNQADLELQNMQAAAENLGTFNPLPEPNFIVDDAVTSAALTTYYQTSMRSVRNAHAELITAQNYLPRMGANGGLLPPINTISAHDFIELAPNIASFESGVHAQDSGLLTQFEGDDPITMTPALANQVYQAWSAAGYSYEQMQAAMSALGGRLPEEQTGIPESLGEMRSQIREQYGQEGLAIFDSMYRRDRATEFSPYRMNMLDREDRADFEYRAAVDTYVGFTALMDATNRAANPNLWGTTGDANAQDLAGLSKGASGDEVKQLQRDLAALGYFPENIIDNEGAGFGQFGDITAGALHDFQIANGIPVSDTIDPATVNALMHPHPAAQFPANGPALAQAAELGGATGPVQVLPDGSVYQTFEHGYVMVNTDNIRTVRNLEGQDIIPPTKLATFTSVEEASPHFVNEWGETATYQDGDPTTLIDPTNHPAVSLPGAYTPYGYNDCGPAAALIALSSLGLIAHPSPSDAPQVINDIRTATGDLDGTMYMSSVDQGLQQYGASTNYIDNNINAINTALGNGHPVVLGSYAEWAAWGSQQPGGNMINNVDPGGHFVTVVGMTPQGDYIVADPLMAGGPITVSPQQMQTFLNSSFAKPLEVSRP
ncbi:MAG: peptidoglycan-binding protein [Deltaproteobacteria bacterium]|nr:peptidoglycan-binding protein [Deltaproteobacteria bacterium]